MLQLTKELGAIKTLLPIFIFPTITALVPIHTSSPITGVPFLLPLFSWPIVTPVAILQFFPIITFGLIVIKYYSNIKNDEEFEKYKCAFNGIFCMCVL